MSIEPSAHPRPTTSMWKRAFRNAAHGVGIRRVPGAAVLPALLLGLVLSGGILTMTVRQETPAPGWAGFAAAPVSAKIAARFGLGEPSGFVIVALHPTGPAAAIGLRPGDIVVRVDGAKIQNARAWLEDAPSLGSGTVLELDVVRDGQTIGLSLTLEPDPEG